MTVCVLILLIVDDSIRADIPDETIREWRFVFDFTDSWRLYPCRDSQWKNSGMTVCVLILLTVDDSIRAEIPDKKLGNDGLCFDFTNN
jgi:hypothetical protein